MIEGFRNSYDPESVSRFIHNLGIKLIMVGLIVLSHKHSVE